MEKHSPNPSESEDSAVDMATTRENPGSAKSRMRSGKGARYNSSNNNNNNNNKDKSRLPSARRLVRAPKSTEINPPSPIRRSSEAEESIDPEEKNLQYLTENLKTYSRQRLRAVHMSLRHYSNVDARVSNKDLNQAFHDNGIKMPSRMHQMLVDKFADHQGIDYERLYRYITEAHSKSGRDSVVAMRSRNDLIPRQEVTQEERDADLLRRLEEQLIRDQSFFDISCLRESFQQKDKNKSGQVPYDEMLDICTKSSPLYGALLKNLLARCDTEVNKKISWPEFINFLERSQASAWEKFPEMAELPEKAKECAKNQPDPVIELSESTKTKLMSKLLKKSRSIKKKAETSQNVLSNDNKVPSTPLSKSMSENNMNDINQKENLNADLFGKENTSSVDKNQPNSMTAESEQKKTEPAMKKISGLVKTSSGFLNSVKSFIKGGKKTDEPKSTQPSQDNTNDGQGNKPMPDIIVQKEMAANAQKETGNSGTPKIKKREKEFKDDKASNKPETGQNVVDAESENKSDDNFESKFDITREHQLLSKENTQLPHKLYCDIEVNESSETIEIRANNKGIVFDKPGYSAEKCVFDPPKERLVLDWVYGYRGNDCRSNIHKINDDEIVYFVSKIAVIYDRATHRQKHYKEHTEDIKCLSINASRNVVASGQFAGKDSAVLAHIRVWRVDTLATMQLIGCGVFTKAVMCLAFAPNKDLVAAVDNSPEKKLTVWDSTNGELLAETILTTETICDVVFNPKSPETIVSIGKEHLIWWKIYEENNMMQIFAQPDFESNLKAKYVTCAIHNDRGDLITGDSNGTIYIWGVGSNKVTNFIKHAHDGPVFTLLCHKGCLLSGGRDSTIHCWMFNKNMDNTGSLLIPKSEGGIRMLQIHSGSLLIGTTMNSLLSLQINQKQFYPLEGVSLDPVPITQGHFDDLRGLATISKSEMGGDFISAGLAGIICWYDSVRKDPVCKLVLKGCNFLCVDCSPSGKLLTLGTRDGHLMLVVIEGESSTEILNKKISRERINTVKFSPDCEHVAVGCHDGEIIIVSLQHKEDGDDQWEITHAFKEHTGSIVSIDWSITQLEDSFILRSCSNGMECLFWRMGTMQMMKQSDLVPDTIWQTRNAIFGAELAGLWASKQAHVADINSIDVNQSGTLVTMGDSGGYISLFRYPSLKKDMFSHTYRSHTCVYKVIFVGDSPTIITIGGKDTSVLQWRII